MYIPEEHRFTADLFFHFNLKCKVERGTKRAKCFSFPSEIYLIIGSNYKLIQVNDCPGCFLRLGLLPTTGFSPAVTIDTAWPTHERKAATGLCDMGVNYL